MGEGWSDWWGLALTAKPGQPSTLSRAVGYYVLNQPTTGACGTCHDAGTADTTGGTVFPTKNHPGHLTAAYGPGLAAFSAGANCAEGAGCHPKWGLAPLGSQANRAKDLRSTATDNGEVSVSLGTTQVCRNCHSTYASSQGTGDTLVRTQANWDNPV